AATEEDFRRSARRQVEEAGRKRTAADPRGAGRDHQRHPRSAGEDPAPRNQPELHSAGTSTTSPAERPKTSSSYISEARAGAAWKVPAVVARARYEKTCSPPERR